MTQYPIVIPKRFFIKLIFYPFCVIVLGLIAIASNLHAQGKGRAKVAEGNQLFTAGKYDEANNAYRDAQLDNPTSPVIDYNIANTLYEKKNYEEAIKLYDKLTKNTDDPVLQKQAYFNLGNTLYRLHKLPESILAYKEALKIDPNDEDAKYNLEYVRAKLKQNADKQDQGQEQQQNPQQEKIDPSEYAKKLKAQAEALVARREYAQAYELMMEGLQKDETVAAYQDFIDRIKDVVAIDAR
jgi:tetratricopeptide (TPR) repeat protein